MSEVLKQRRRKAGDEADAPAPVSSASSSEPTSRPAAVATSSIPPVTGYVPPAWDIVTRNEKYVPYFIFLVAAFTRFYRLDQPPGSWVT